MYIPISKGGKMSTTLILRLYKIVKEALECLLFTVLTPYLNQEGYS